MAEVSRGWHTVLRMIAVVAGIAALVPSITTALWPAKAASLDEIKKRGSLIVATEDDFRPFEFVQDGKPTGFDKPQANMMLP